MFSINEFMLWSLQSATKGITLDVMPMKFSLNLSRPFSTNVNKTLSPSTNCDRAYANTLVNSTFSLMPALFKNDLNAGLSNFKS